MSDRFINYDAAKKVIKAAKIKTMKEYRAYSRKNSLPIPYHPERYYKEWEGWPKFLGTDRKSHKSGCVGYLSYEEAKKILRDELIDVYNINSIVSYKNFVKTKDYEEKYSKKLPRGLDYYYKKPEFVSLKDLLSIDYNNGMEYDELKSILSENGIKNIKDLTVFMYSNKDMNIPSDIEKTYTERGTWKGWDDLFGCSKECQMPKKSEAKVEHADAVNKNKNAELSDLLGDLSEVILKIKECLDK